MDATLQAEKRDGRGKNEARRLRASGRIPGGRLRRREGQGDRDRRRPEGAAADPALRVRRQHADRARGFDLGGGKVLVKEYQLDPIDHKLLHADFYAVAMDKALTVTVPIVLKGEPKGVKQQGGIVDFVNREIEIECLPGDIPEHIDVDITELMLHQGIRVRDLPRAKWKPVSDADMMIVHVVTLKVEEAPAAEAAAAAARGGAGRARSHQEGQEGRGREKKTEKKRAE